ncbi:MAG: dipicolinate synthase subunit B [Firmicutes bacterium]|nr:dipicolinate synthase subunit B [Bacillota bacterium]
MNNLFFVVDHNHKDKRAGALCKILKTKGYEVGPVAREGKNNIYVLMPRDPTPTNILPNSVVVDFKYLSSCEDFVLENNHLTALAFVKHILKPESFKGKNILIMGYGKLTIQLEPVLVGAKLSILNFNRAKCFVLDEKYGDRHFFEYAPLENFDIIINTIPSQVVGEAELKKAKGKVKIYELASAPYGFNFGKLNPEKFGYQIEPSLPGRFLPTLAANAIYNVLEAKFIKCTGTNCAIEKQSVVFGITGCSCCYASLLSTIKQFTVKYNVLPIMSVSANQTTRFVEIESFKKEIEEITGHRVAVNIQQAERFSADKSIQAVVICPCSGNTMAKISHAITDTPVIMAAKAVTRNNKPCVVAFSTNDGIGNNFENVGRLINKKNYYVVPFNQDDYKAKPNSLAYNPELVFATVEAAIEGRQLQPIIYVK